MRSFKLILALLLLGLGPASAQLTQTGAGQKAGGGGPPPTGKILLVDGVSFILQVDAASKICRAVGC